MFTKNFIQLTGHVAREPQLRRVGDSSVARARLIHNETIRKADGETVERLVAIDLEIWGNRGEAFAQYITSKVPVCIEGRLQLDEWEQEGQPRSRLFVRVEDWHFLTHKQEGAEAGPSRGANRNRRGGRAA